MDQIYVNGWDRQDPVRADAVRRVRLEETRRDVLCSVQGVVVGAVHATVHATDDYLQLLGQYLHHRQR